MSNRSRSTISRPSSALDTGTTRSPRLPSICTNWRCTLPSGSTTRTVSWRMASDSSEDPGRSLPGFDHGQFNIEASLGGRRADHAELAAVALDNAAANAQAERARSSVIAVGGIAP